MPAEGFIGTPCEKIYFMLNINANNVVEIRHWDDLSHVLGDTKKMAKIMLKSLLKKSNYNFYILPTKR